MQDGKLHKISGRKNAEIVQNHEFCLLTFDSKQNKSEGFTPRYL